MGSTNRETYLQKPDKKVQTIPESSVEVVAVYTDMQSSHRYVVKGKPAITEQITRKLKQSGFKDESVDS